jgi:hypothetical protein
LQLAPRMAQQEMSCYYSELARQVGGSDDTGPMPMDVSVSIEQQQQQRDGVNVVADDVDDDDDDCMVFVDGVSVPLHSVGKMEMEKMTAQEYAAYYEKCVGQAKDRIRKWKK